MSCSKHEKPLSSATENMPATASPSSVHDFEAPSVAVAEQAGNEPELDHLECLDPQTGVAKIWTVAERQLVVGQLLEKHFDRVYRYAYHLSGCASAAEDISQEVFLRAFRSVHQLRDEQASAGWLLTIARNEFGRYCQARKTLLDIDQHAPQEKANHVQSIDSQEWVHFALNQLPIESRTVVLMFYFEEKSYSQIATELGLPMGTVMSRLSRARSHLKHALDSQRGLVSSSPNSHTLVKDHQ